MTEGSEPTIETRTPSRTTVLPPVVSPLPRPGLIALLFCAVAAAFFLVGIALASLIRPPPAGVVTASREVGPAGATIRFDAGEIRIPSGALASSTRIVVRRMLAPERVQVRPPRGPLIVFDSGELVAYIFEPTDVTFRRPVTIMFRPRQKTTSAAVFARLDETTLLLSDQIDADRGTVTIEVRDFRFNRGQPIGAGS